MSTVEERTIETAEDVGKVLTGAPMALELENPLDTGKPWFMRQPTDIEYEIGVAVRESVRRRVLAEPDVTPSKALPPSDEWIATQVRSMEEAKEWIAELEAIDPRDPIQNLMLDTYKGYLESLIKPEEYSLAEELAATAASRSFQAHLIPRLLVDEQGKSLFNMDTPAGKQAWAGVDRSTKRQLRVPFTRLINLVSFTAKNSPSSPRSS